MEAKNLAEVELATQRIDLMQVNSQLLDTMMMMMMMIQVNSQLLDTVQHKVRLSEQLEEMEVNIVSQIQAGGNTLLVEEKCVLSKKMFQCELLTNE